MASSVLALTMATLLKGNATTADASAAERGLIRSKSGRKSVAADTGSGDEKSDVIPAAPVQKPAAAKESEGTDSPALQAPPAQRMSLLQRVLSRGKQQPISPENTPAEADAVSVHGAGEDNDHADGTAANGSAVSRGAIEAAAESNQDPYVSPADAATAADAAPAGSAYAEPDVGSDDRRGRPARIDGEAAREQSGKVAPAPSEDAAAEHVDAALVHDKDSAKPAQLVAPTQLVVQRSQPQQQCTQRQPPPAGAEASTARVPPPGAVAASPAARQQQPRREPPQVRCACVRRSCFHLVSNGVHGWQR